jgi:hypothetical protein
VSTGQHLQCIHDIPVSHFINEGDSILDIVFIERNTNFIAVFTNWTMNIYDLEAMRNQYAKPQEFLCASVKVSQIILK